MLRPPCSCIIASTASCYSLFKLQLSCKYLPFVNLERCPCVLARSGNCTLLPEAAHDMHVQHPKSVMASETAHCHILQLWHRKQKNVLH